MLSFKASIRRSVSILTILAATLALAGCSTTGESDSLSSSDLISSEISSDVTNSDDIDIDIGTEQLYSEESFDMRYKHWYDSIELTQAQLDQLDTAKAGTHTGEKLLDTFQLYADGNGRTYYISGYEPVYLPGGNEVHGLSRTRDETGKMYYSHLTGLTSSEYLAEFREATEGKGKSASDYADIFTNNEFAKFEDGKVYKVFVNNLSTNDVFIPTEFGMPITDWLARFNLATVDTTDPERVEIYQNTGAGVCMILFSRSEKSGWEGDWQITYPVDGTELQVDSSQVTAVGDTVYFTPEAIQRVLGYYIEVYPNAINIITDIKDLADERSAFPSQLPVQTETSGTSTGEDVPEQHTPIIL